MPDQETTIVALAVAAVSIGFIHTLFGPDHYLPFIVMSRAREWSRTRTVWITFLCGLGHVGSSVVLGSIGVALGIAVNKVTPIEDVRGSIVAWLLIAFGLAYAVWGLRRAWRNKPHTHAHFHLESDSTGEHRHNHRHDDEHAHVHDLPAGRASGEKRPSITPWVLFTVFVFGPCEPLIPLLMYPAATRSAWGLGLVTGLFALTTIGTMLTVVLMGSWGVSFLPFRKLERYTHALAGATIALCGVAIVFGL